MNDSWFRVAAYCALAGLNKKFRWQHRASPDADIYRPFRAFIFLRENLSTLRVLPGQQMLPDNFVIMFLEPA